MMHGANHDFCALLGNVHSSVFSSHNRLRNISRIPGASLRCCWPNFTSIARSHALNPVQTPSVPWFRCHAHTKHARPRSVGPTSHAHVRRAPASPARAVHAVYTQCAVHADLGRRGGRLGEERVAAIISAVVAAARRIHLVPRFDSGFAPLRQLGRWTSRCARAIAETFREIRLPATLKEAKIAERLVERIPRSAFR